MKVVRQISITCNLDITLRFRERGFDSQSGLKVFFTVYCHDVVIHRCQRYYRSFDSHRYTHQNIIQQFIWFIPLIKRSLKHFVSGSDSTGAVRRSFQSGPSSRTSASSPQSQVIFPWPLAGLWGRVTANRKRVLRGAPGYPNRNAAADHIGICTN